MAGFSFGPFIRQLQALTRKNFLVAVLRRPIGFLLCVYVIPLVILGVLLSVPDFVSSSNRNGVASPAPIQNLADTVHKKIVVVTPPHLGPDVKHVVNTFTKGIDDSLLQFVDGDGELSSICVANLRGVSDCHAAVTFVDSPETTKDVPKNLLTYDEQDRSRHTWYYDIRLDPAKYSGVYDATTHDNKAEEVQLPLQLAINNAITNGTSIPRTFAFTSETQAEKERQDQIQGVELIVGIFVFAMFTGYLFIAYRHTSIITSERDSGMAQLVDSMGGGSIAAARVFAWLITFNLSCLPVFIIFGVLFSQLLLPSVGAGLLIAWQILLGFAVNSSTVFAAAFFSKARLSSIYVVAVFLLVCVGAQLYSAKTIPPPRPSAAYAMSLLFPSSNFVFFLVQLCYWEMAGKAPDLGVLPPGAPEEVRSMKITQGEMLGFVAVHIFVYPILAIAVESFMYRINFRNRSFAADDSEWNGAVAEAFDLKKQFVPSFLDKIFCCGRKRGVMAADGVSFQGHKGQILCLVGPNGSGKTTTLHMMSGFIKPTSGSVSLGVSPSQLGICPQRNTLWEELTVAEHIDVWNQIKAAHETPEEMKQLITACDLEAKYSSKSKALSGGQKRKLQLACMFVGGSSVCLIDECTSGLDPLSRRVIWDILMEQRAKRSIVFTTHYLDEVDVLADQIVILTKGHIKCQGASAELKNLHGGGYRVLVPSDTATRVDVPYPPTRHQDRMVYTTPDSQTAAQVASKFSAAGVSDIGFAGPQFEDVFLRVAADTVDEIANWATPAVASNFELEPAQQTSFWSQFRTLFRKRLTVLKRFWLPYLWVVALPLIITPNLKGTLKEYVIPPCSDLVTTASMPYSASYSHEKNCEVYGACDKIAVAPPSANRTLYDLFEKQPRDLRSIDKAAYHSFVEVKDDGQQLVDYTSSHRKTMSGGIYMGSNGEPPMIAFEIGSNEILANQNLNLWSEMQLGDSIQGSIGQFAEKGNIEMKAGTLYSIYFALVQSIWPAMFVLYPAIEKARCVRSLEYANGVRRGPLWLAYGAFDGMFVLINAVACSVIMLATIPWNSSIQGGRSQDVMIMLPILLFYGFAAMLLGFVVSHFVDGPLKSALAMAGIQILMFAISAIAFAVGSGFSDPSQVDPVTNGIVFGLNLILPIGNVFRALLLGLNVMQVGCRNGAVTPTESIYGFGGPICYLIIQLAVLLLIIIWIEGDLALFRRKEVRVSSRPAWEDTEKTAISRSAEVEAEKMRVENSEEDLLRILSLDKSFGPNHAVQNVSLGLPRSDVMGLLGPNGAGKSTLVNMIQSELSPDRGQILLGGEDTRTRSAQRNLGVCPQFDALDMMNTREHLEFYARVRGITDVKGNVDHIMGRLALTPHAKTPASKLSGGNKRKLSLAIALVGAPRVMVLDEPTSAMDAVAKRSFWKLIQNIAPGRSILLTTHSMEEADTLSTRAAIISQRLLTVGTTEALREKYSNVYYVSLLLYSGPNSSKAEMHNA